MPDLMKLSIPITAEGTAEAMRAFKMVETQGQRTASQYAEGWKWATNRVTRDMRMVEEAAKRSNAAVASSSNAMASRYARAAFQIAGVASAITIAGKSTTNQMNRLIGLASSVAFAFGPTGAIVGSIGISLVTIREMFERTRKEMEETKRKAIDTIHDIFAERELSAARSRAQGLESQIVGLELGELGFAQARRQEMIAARRHQMPTSTDEQIASLILRQQRGIGGEFTDVTKRIEELTKALVTLKDQAAAARIVVQHLERQERALSQARTLGGIRAGFTGKLSDLVGGDARADEARVRAAIAPRQRVVRPSLKGIATAAQLKENIQQTVQQPAIEAIGAMQESINAAIETHVVGGIGEALAGGFERAFARGGNVIMNLFKGLTSGILSSMGSMFIQIGKNLISFSSIMQSLIKGLQSIFTTPAASFVAGAALIALGSVMTRAGGGGALNSGQGGYYGGGVGGGGRGFSGREVMDRATQYRLNPNTLDVTKLNRPGVFAPTVVFLGNPSPAHERWVGETYQRWVNRGGSRG